VKPHTPPSYLGAGFVLALSVRLLTSALVIVVPLFAVGALGVTPSEAGGYVLLIWVGNALGVSAAVLALRDQSAASVAGFTLAALSMVGLAAGGGRLAPLFILTSGAGGGLPQPFLSAFMHSDSPPERPFSGLGLYSAALGTGLILGPLVAYGAYPVYGFAGAFLALVGVCAVGVAGAAAGHGSASGRPKPPRPSPRSWALSLRGGRFSRAVAVNFLYSLLLPLYLSYAGILAETRFGFSPEAALLLFTAVFAASVALRLVAVKARPGLPTLLVTSSVVLLLGTIALWAAPSWPFFVAAMLAFSLPHAYVFPIANYFALKSADGDLMNASYAFQASSAVAEFLTPSAAVLLVPLLGVQNLFLVGALCAAGVVAGSAQGFRRWDGGQEKRF
jgi:hypothetical protein